MGVSSRTVTADRGDAGRRLDLVLRRHLSDVERLTRTRLQAWIEAGQVTVNGERVQRVATRTALGDVVEIVLPEQAPRRTMEAEDSRLEILHEDDHLLAVSKPAGVVVHPAYRNPTGTLMNALLWYARQWPAPQRPTLVGRLDKLTSGVVLVAKTASMHAALQRVLGSTAAEKDYLALVYGAVKVRRGSIDLPLRPDPFDRRRIILVPTGGARSLTLFETLGRAAIANVGLSLLRCRLRTGRTHQIRVHLAARGWPIVGDATYGMRARSGDAASALLQALTTSPRHALHSWRLSFSHPVSGLRVSIEAPVPLDMAQLLESSGLGTALARHIGQVKLRDN